MIFNAFSFQELKSKGRRPSDNEGLFDEVFKKSLVYSQKYTPGKQNNSVGDGEGLGVTGKGSGKIETKRDSSARSDLLSVRKTSLSLFFVNFHLIIPGDPRRNYGT